MDRIRNPKTRAILLEIKELEAELALTPEWTIRDAYTIKPTKVRRLVTLLCAVNVNVDRAVLRLTGVDPKAAVEEVWAEELRR